VLNKSISNSNKGGEAIQSHCLYKSGKGNVLAVIGAQYGSE